MPKKSAKPLRIGLTGGIGSGKSTVAKIFEALGIPVFYADDEAKKLMNTNPELISNIQSIFGTETYNEQGLNRQVLAKKVFGDPYQLERLNAIVHPATIAAVEHWFTQQNTAYVVKEAALLFEAGTAGGLDFIIGVHAPQHLRLQRTMKRDGATKDLVLDRMNRQIDEGIKMKLCDFVLVNDEQQLLTPQVIKLNQLLLQKTGA